MWFLSVSVKVQEDVEAAGRQGGQGGRARTLLPQTAGARAAEARAGARAPHLATCVPQQPWVGQRLGARPAGRPGPTQPLRRQQHGLLLPQIGAGAPALAALCRSGSPQGRGASRRRHAGGTARKGCRVFGRPSPRAQPPGLRGTSEARADRRRDFSGHCAATDTPSLVGTSWWPPRRLQIQPREGGSLQPKTPHLPSGSGSRQPRASPGPSHHGFAPRGRTFSRHLASHT